MNQRKKDSKQNKAASKTISAATLANVPSKWVFFIISALCFILYGNTLGHGYVLDDEMIILSNRFVQSGFKGLGDIFSSGFLDGSLAIKDVVYRPLVLASFAIEHQLFGNNPRIGHLINVLLFVICVQLVWFNLSKLLSNYSPWLPFLVTLVFIAHPIHTEVVANLKSRDELLAFLFAMAALRFTIKYLENNTIVSLLLSSFYFLLAMLSKESVLGFLLIIPLTLWFFTSSAFKRLAVVFISLALSVTFYFTLRSLLLDSSATLEAISPVNNILAGAENMVERLSTAIYILFLYLVKLFVPLNLSWDYSVAQINLVNLSDWQTWLAILVLLGLVVVAMQGFKYKSIWSWAIIYFFISIAVVSNVFFLIGATMADRFLFTPSFGFSLALVWLVAFLSKTDLASQSWIKKTQFIVPLITVFVLFSIKTIDRNGDWKSNERLYESGVKTAPKSTRTWQALGSAYRKNAELSKVPNLQKEWMQKAMDCYNKSIEISDLNFDALYNLGVCYNFIGQGERAFTYFEKTIAANPNFVAAYNNIGVYYFNKNLMERAREFFEQVLTLEPNHIDAHFNMAVAYHKEGNSEMAKEWYQKTLNLAPQHAMAKANLAKLNGI